MKNDSDSKNKEDNNQIHDSKNDNILNNVNLNQTHFLKIIFQAVIVII